MTAKERARLCVNEWWNDNVNIKEEHLVSYVERAILAAVAEERERCVGLIAPLRDEINDKSDADVRDASWNPEAHIEITLTIQDCRNILDLIDGTPLEPPAVRRDKEVRKMRKLLEVISCMTAKSEHPDNCECDYCIIWNAIDDFEHPENAAIREASA